MRRSALVLAALALVLALAPAAHAATFGPWSAEIDLEDIPGTSDQIDLAGQDGRPIESPDGLSLYLASNRPRFAGDLRTDLDIWVSHRARVGALWECPGRRG